MTSVHSDPLIGQTLDERYVIRSRIARGGMAMVYLANDLRLERRVAVKVMHEHLAEDENFTRRFEQEARSAAGLSHPNLVNVFDQGHDKGRTYLVMEYLPSITLRDLLKQQKRLTIEQTLEVSEAVLAGLSAAHQADIVHRDLKPENVMLADDGRIKLGDFGLARAVSANTTTGQALLGTIAYLSPELVTRGVADARSDLYAFGVMLYEMLTGSQPFTGEQPMQIAYQHAHSEVPLPSLKNPETTQELDELVRWTTQREPDQRPRNAGEALEYLSALRHGEPPQATRMLPPLGTTVLTPSTTVLDEAQQGLLAAGLDPAAEARDRRRAPTSALEAVANAAHRRNVRGRFIAIGVVALIALAGGIGLWFGQGPGSQVVVPDLIGETMESARASLTERSLGVEESECSSLKVPAGRVAATTPKVGTRLDRDSIVRLCKSTGPELRPVPTIVGLSVSEAKIVIKNAGFSFGKVIEKRFSDEAVDVVLAALGTDDEPLGETYPEQARVNLVVSAGSIPEVAGLTEKEAKEKLTKSDLKVDPELSDKSFNAKVVAGSVIALTTNTDPLRPGDPVGLQISAGSVPDIVGMKVKQATDALAKSELKVDPELNSEAHSDEVPEGAVISLTLNTDPVRPGDAVGLQVSLGPELFAVPDVAGMGLQEAMDTLTSAGFDPSTLVPDALRGLATATETNPVAGEMVPAGTTISVKSTLKL